MVKQTETIRRQSADELFECSVFGHFVGLALKGLTSRCSLMSGIIFGNLKSFNDDEKCFFLKIFKFLP